MKQMRSCKKKWFGLVSLGIILGGLCIAIVATLVGIEKIHQISEENKLKMKAAMQVQNLMEYCKINKEQLESTLNHLAYGGYEEENHTKWIIYYDANWQNTNIMEQVSYSIEVYIKTTPYTYADLKEITLKSYRIQNYNLQQRQMKGIGKTFILELEGSCIIEREEK